MNLLHLFESKWYVILCLVITSCTPMEFPVSVDHEQGKHYSTDQEVRNLVRNKNTIDSYTFVFTEQCKYFIPKNDACYLGWNKSLGTSSGLIHYNSHRLVWRYNCTNDLFEIAEYWYRDGERDWKVIGQGKVQRPIEVSFEKKYMFTTASYFGGQHPAPHDMKYFVR